MAIESRRYFLKASLGIGSVLLWGCKPRADKSSDPSGLKGRGKLGASQPMRIRKSIWRLAKTDPEVKAYAEAVARMRALPLTDPRSWSNFAAMHRDSCPHGNSFFFPWHRGYLDYFERSCRDILGDQSFALPYWDWSENSSIPEAFWEGSLLEPTRELKKDQSLFERLVESEPGAEDIWRPENIKRIQTIDNYQNYVGRTKVRVVAKKLQRAKGDGLGKSPVGGELENSPHNMTHGTIGGPMGAFMSPLDPIFWLHHANIDRLWAEWSLQNGEQTQPAEQIERQFWLDFDLWYDYAGTDAADVMLAKGKPTSVFTLKVSEALTTERFGYRYDTTASETMQLAQTVVRPAVESPKEDISVESAGLKPVINGNIVSFMVPVFDQLRRAYGRFLTYRTDPSYNPVISLQIYNVPPPKDPLQILELYLDDPNLTPGVTQGFKRAHYVGNLGFFVHKASDHEDHGSNVVSFDLRHTLERMSDAGWGLGDIVKLEIAVQAKNSRYVAADFSDVVLRLEYIEY